jgi:hypothetical protein
VEKCELLDLVEGPVKSSTSGRRMQNSNVTQGSDHNRINIPVHVLSPCPRFLGIDSAILVSLDMLTLAKRISERATRYG